MTTAVIESVVSTLGALVAGRCYPEGEAPETPAPPFIIWQDTVSTVMNTLSDGSPIDQMRMQVDCYARTKLDLLTLAGQVRDALESAALDGSINNVCISTQGVYEPAVKLQREIMEFSIWH